MALPVALALVSCNSQLSEETSAEISFEAVSCAETKGFVKGSDLSEESGTPRNIIVSAYDAARQQTFFQNSTFKLDNGSWKNFVSGIHQPVFWDSNSRLDFMAYSVGSSHPTAAWDIYNPSYRLILQIGSDSLDDDILYASVKNCTRASAGADGSVSLDFKHAQAWIDIEVFSEDADIYSTGITFPDVQASGNLIITDNLGYPEASWDFNSYPRVSHRITPASGPLPVPGLDSSTPVKYSILLPQQQRCEFNIHFTAGTGTEEHSCTYSLDTDKFWYSGKHYTYKINVTTRDMVPAGPSASRSRRVSAIVEEQDF